MIFPCIYCCTDQQLWVISVKGKEISIKKYLWLKKTNKNNLWSRWRWKLPGIRQSTSVRSWAASHQQSSGSTWRSKRWSSWATQPTCSWCSGSASASVSSGDRWVNVLRCLPSFCYCSYFALYSFLLHPHNTSTNVNTILMYLRQVVLKTCDNG